MPTRTQTNEPRRTLLLTGASRGIGHATVKRFSAAGWRVITCSRHAFPENCPWEMGPEDHIQVDLASTDDTMRAIAEIQERLEPDGSRLDALVNNAGITKHVPNHADLDGLAMEDFQRLYAVNVVGPFQMVRAARALLERANRPSVLMVSSIAGVTGIGSSVAYAASKGALNTMTLSLARALAPKIRVNALCPGFIDTRWFTDAFGAQTTDRIRENVKANTPLKEASTAEDIADSGLFLISDAARHVTGETLLVDAGLHLGFAPLAAR